MTSSPSAVRSVRAVHDPALAARVVRRRPLYYTAGADATDDRPAHVRAGSGMVWAGDRLVIVQDDANFVAVVDPRSGDVLAVPLPRGDDGRRQFDDGLGNKALKLDLEAVVRVPDETDGTMLLAFGSGSTARRDAIVVLRGLAAGVESSRVEVRSASALYARLRARTEFAGSELNVEAVVYHERTDGGRLRLFNRGNGAPLAGLLPVNATCDVPWPAFAAYLADPSHAAPPPIGDVLQFELGAVGDVPLSFTDAALVRADEARAWTLYTAAAELSPDATRDGPVAGVAIGVIAEGRGGIAVRWTLLRDVDGSPFTGKVEGIALRADDPGRVHVVVDRDAPGEASELCDVVLDGRWLGDSSGGP